MLNLYPHRQNPAALGQLGDDLEVGEGVANHGTGTLAFCSSNQFRTMVSSYSLMFSIIQTLLVGSAREDNLVNCLFTHLAL